MNNDYSVTNPASFVIETKRLYDPLYVFLKGTPCIFIFTLQGIYVCMYVCMYVNVKIKHFGVTCASSSASNRWLCIGAKPARLSNICSGNKPSKI